jgi:hypothetical protein
VFARLHTLKTTPESHERGLQIVREELLPWTRESSGFRGLIGLLDRASGKSLVLTLWADEEALERSAEAGERLSGLAAQVSGSQRESIESYEVTFFDVSGV